MNMFLKPRLVEIRLISRMELGEVHADDIDCGKSDEFPGLPVRYENYPRLCVSKKNGLIEGLKESAILLL